MAEKKEEKPDKGPPAETPTPLAPAPAPLDFDLVVERWFQDWFPGSAVARDTEAWNTAYRAKENLKQRLKGD